MVLPPAALPTKIVTAAPEIPVIPSLRVTLPLMLPAAVSETFRVVVLAGAMLIAFFRPVPNPPALT